jgi:TonB family protein
VAGIVRAATAGGSITAWINPGASSRSAGGTVHLAGPSQLTSGKGDIVVFLPRNLAADIDATVESGGIHRIEADPALSLNIQTPAPGNGSVHAMAAMNGGGPPLKLRTNAGTIHLQFLDSEIALRNSLIREQKDRLNERLNGFPVIPANYGLPEMHEVPGPAAAPEDKGDWIDSWLDRLQVVFLGGVREDADEFKKRLISSPPPAYPDIARRAGLQGIVRLQVRTTQDGRVEVQKIIEGEPALADAAIAAVKQWRVKPVLMNGTHVDVISTVSFNFQLH